MSDRTPPSQKQPASPPSRGSFSQKKGSSPVGPRVSPSKSPSISKPPQQAPGLFVDGLSRVRVSGNGASYAFRSGSSIGDAHIKALSSMYSTVPFASPHDAISPDSKHTAAFRSTLGSGRDSHIRDLSDRTYAANFSPPSARPSSRGGCTAAFRSKSPSACAHIQAVPKPVDASYLQPSPSAHSQTPSSFYKSGSSIADAHIKAVPRKHDSSSPLPSMVGSRSYHAAFRSTTTIGDAHIKALPKPVDTCVAFR